MSAEHQRAYRERHPDRVSESCRKYRDSNREKVRDSHRKSKVKWKAANREKHLAQMALYRAVRAGRLIRPDRCEFCGSECKPHGHHRDYSRRLDVIWLCEPCHKTEHAGGKP